MKNLRRFERTTYEHLDSVEQLNLQNEIVALDLNGGAAEIQGIEKLKLLRFLELRETEMYETKLKLLKKLSRLERLRLVYCNIDDITPLRSLVNLVCLDLSTNKI